MNKARWVVLAALAALLLIPFVLRWKNPAEPAAAVPADCDRLVIVTAHNKAVCDEYEYAFRRYYRENFHRDIKIEFLCPGGTSDIVRFISDRFEAEFRHHWENRHRLWKPAYAGCFCDPKYDAVAADSEAGQLRREFLNSEIGIGIDVFAGGGTFEQQRMAAKGYAVPGGVERRHPEYFRHIPAVFGGETVYDRDGRYYGVVLSTFGIACNTDRLSVYTLC